MSWEIFLGIVAIIGFVITVSTPMMKLNTSITKLSLSIEHLQEVIKRNETENQNAHDELKNHNKDQDKIIQDHESRIDAIEHTIDLHEKLHPELTK